MSLDGVPLVHVVAVTTGLLDDVAMFICEASSCWWLVHFCQYGFVPVNWSTRQHNRILFIFYKVRLHVSTIHVAILRSLIV